ncbi:SMI1/KNR4 family protein [Leptospira noguchii]|uniref:SMI1/KNR4 family protein n=1 Tax=Leptospira noguchii str. 2001034031 TaxID=1193053 RepID=M6Y7V8_9LEPT|nr:SMI1/KNR4 family protein [Leptospira noguchii]EMO89830.1 hypothetical protein LEP1GSC024_0858 [Leptospira noguchii str. 2001034031]
MTSIENLINISSVNIGRTIKEESIEQDFHSLVLSQKFSKEITEIIIKRNGFFTFESALHFFHYGKNAENDYNSLWWNDLRTWKEKYQNERLHSSFCFAQDGFGNQFCFDNGGIYIFDVETGEFEFISHSIEDWAKKVLDDFNFLTGFPLLHEWQLQNGPVKFGFRLIPKIPFCLGGEYSVANLHTIESIKALNWRAEIYNQIKNLPDGAEIIFSQIE